MDSDIQKTLDNFRLKHQAHNLECQKYYDTCPVCQIIVDEQTDKYLNALEEEFKSIVCRHWKRWNCYGVTIANEIQPEVLSGILSYNAFENWLEPQYYDIEITDDELFRHPYVQQKIIDG